jgi:hypothetical protein
MKQELINKIPKDILLFHIIPFTYSPQDRLLLQDIKHYISSKKYVLELYYNKYIIEWGEPEPEDKYWIINDIIAFYNGYNATMFEYIDGFYDIFFRIPFIQKREQVTLYIDKIEYRDIQSQINIFWGLFTPEERNQIISNILL